MDDGISRTRPGNPPNGDAPRPSGALRVLMIGDMIGKPGRQAVEQLLPELRDQRRIDFVTANGENVVSEPVKTSDAGVARFEVPLHGAFALTTVPVA